jgi:hypothetical protein
MKYEDLTLRQIQEIKDLKNECTTIGEWKIAMINKAAELGISHDDILKANRS